MASDKSCKNFDNCCRTCLNDASLKTFNIFEDKQDSINVAEMLLICTGLTANVDDYLPKRVCGNCYHHLVGFYNFCLVARKIDAHLRGQINLNSTDKLLSSEKGLSADIKIESNDIDDNFDCIDNQTEIKIEFANQEIDETKNSATFFDVHLKNEYTLEAKVKIQLKCDICHKTFKKLSKLNQHKEKHNSKDNLYVCNICSKTFKQRVKLVNHLVIHNQENKIENSGTNISQSDTNEHFKCEICPSSFKSMHSLSAHMRKHVKKGRVLACNLCDKTFTKVSHLKRHELCHNDNRPFKCMLCPKTFINQSYLTEHMNKHNGIKPHACPLCPKAFSHLSTLTNHIKVHSKEKTYLCPTCGKRFNSSTNLNQHLKRHIGHKSFACNLCPKQFISKGELKSHAKTHTGERSYTCDQCNSKFTKRSSLVKHKLRHLGVKPYKCDVCPMKFSSKDHLKRHYRIHTGEKPYRCEICDRAFTQSNDLVKHRRAHLGDKLYKCSQCEESFRLQTELRQHVSQHYISRYLETKNQVEPKDCQIDTHQEVPIDNEAQFNVILDRNQIENTN